jgi:hypothetical protein
MWKAWRWSQLSTTARGATPPYASMNEGPDPYSAADLGGVHSAPPRTRACLRYRTNRGRSSSVIRKSSSDPISFRRRSPRELQGGNCLRGRYEGWRRTPQNGLSLQRARCRIPIPKVDDSQRASRDRALAPSAQGGPERGSAPRSAESLRRAAPANSEGVPAPQASAVPRGVIITKGGIDGSGDHAVRRGHAR